MNESNNTSGVGFLGLLTILFIGLKLGHVIDWSWWWVVSPIWLSIGFYLSVIIIVLIVRLVISSV